MTVGSPAGRLAGDNDRATTMVEHPDDPFWDDLIFNIEVGNVIPVVGRDLLEVPAEGGDRVPLYGLLAGRLAEAFQVPAPDPSDPNALSDVMCRCPHFHEKPQRVYRRIKAVMERDPPPVPEALRQLAAVSGFGLYLSTTFDDCLQRALDEVRFGGEPQTRALAFSPGKVDDLPAEPPGGAGGAGDPVVYHILGRLGLELEFVATEGDHLEFMHTLHTRDAQPPRLFDQLRSKDLLLIGNGFPDWLARFFLRLTKGDVLWNRRSREEIVVDREVSKDAALHAFLQNFSPNTEIYEAEGPPGFTGELYRRWVAQHPADSLDGARPAGPAAAPGPGGRAVAGPAAAGVPAAGEMAVAGEMAPGSVFLSYAREDEAAAKRVRQALDAAGVDVWMDQGGLSPGETFEKIIQRNIRRCALFVPLLSRSTDAVGGGRFYRKEWAWALRRALEFTGSKIPFILPVVVDDLDIYRSENTPEEFASAHCIFAPGGELGDDFVRQVIGYIRAVRKQEAAGV